MVNQLEAFRRRLSRSWLVNAAKSIGQTAAFVGLVAGFWHITWMAGAAMLAAPIVGVAVYSAGYERNAVGFERLRTDQSDSES